MEKVKEDATMKKFVRPPDSGRDCHNANIIKEIGEEPDFFASLEELDAMIIVARAQQGKDPLQNRFEEEFGPR
ncbi:MAG TPA: hypothetical protein VMU13_01215 [Candidatus Paceibacterota bacterium]|nr:hypothetical protein [Candidatus Paceibacterota bacterium]